MESTRPALLCRRNLNKKYLPDDTCIQNRLLYTLNREKIRLNNANKYIFWVCNILAIQAYVFIIYKFGIVKNTFKKLKDDLLKLFLKGVLNRLLVLS